MDSTAEKWPIIMRLLCKTNICNYRVLDYCKTGCKFCMQQKTNISQINFIIHAHLKCHANAVGAKLKQCKTNNIKM